MTTFGPTQLIVWQINWAYTCKRPTPAIYPPAGGIWYVWYVADNNQDGVWQYVFNGNTLQSKDMGTFVTGDPRANAERKSRSDSNYADFYGLYRMGSGGAWYAWSNVSVLRDTDPDYRNCWYSASLRVIVKQGGC